MTTQNQTATWGALFYGLNGLRVLALCGGVALYAININVINTLLPSIVKDIGGLSLYSLATSLFVAASVFSVALCASLIDRLGLRAAFLLAVLIFLLGSMGVAFSPDIDLLLTARVVQGFGGGLLLGLSYAAIRLVFLEPLWLRATAFITSMWGVAALAGPAVGGLFAQSGHWRWAFLAVIPIAIVVAILIFISLKTCWEDSELPLIKPPIFKAALLSWSILVLIFGGFSGSLLLIALALVITITILYAMSRDDENRASSLLLPQGAYQVSNPLGSLYAGVFLMGIAISGELFVPYFLEYIHQLKPIYAGYLTALIPTGWAFGAVVTAGRKHGVANRLFVIGPLVSAISLVGLGLLLPWQALSAEHQAVWLISLPLFGVGLGVGLIWPHLLTRVFLCAPKGQENTASAGMITLQLYAMSVGAALAGIITSFAGIEIESLEHTQRAAMALFFIFAAVPVVFVFISKAARYASGSTDSVIP